jgi:hypothetical protein
VRSCFGYLDWRFWIRLSSLSSLSLTLGNYAISHIVMSSPTKRCQN